MPAVFEKIGEAIDKGMGLIEAEPAYVIVHDFRASLKTSALDKTKLVSAAAEKALSGEASFSANYIGANNKTFRVQYNPSELRLYTANEAYTKLGEGKKGKEQVVSVTSSISVAEFSVSLFFDHMAVSDSFMLDKPVLPASASAIGNIMTSALAGRYDVQTEVEGFIAALQNRYTRVITFCWNKFSFTGTLTSVTAEYTMFSTLGRPVRAKVALRMRKQADEKFFSEWANDFEKAFKGDSSNLVTFDQYTSNLINLNLGF